MSIEPLSALPRSCSLKDQIAQVATLVLDVGATLAETEAIFRRAFNAAFMDAGLHWHWDHQTYKQHLRTTGGK